MHEDFRRASGSGLRPGLEQTDAVALLACGSLLDPALVPPDTRLRWADGPQRPRHASLEPRGREPPGRPPGCQDERPQVRCRRQWQTVPGRRKTDETTMRSTTAATLNSLRGCGWQFSLTLVLVLSGCVGPRPSETSTTALESDTALGARMDAAAAGALRDIRAAGFSVAVVSRGQTVLAKGYGYADLAERVPASASTIYRLASITKQFTAAAILHLAEEGRLSLDDRISDHLPDYPALDRRITIRSLLSHTSGLSDVAVAPILEEGSGVGYTRDQIIDLVASQPLDFDPGTGHSYSNVGFMLAGAVIEEVTGTTYADYLTNEVIRPLGLDQTSFCPDDQPRADRWAHGYDVQHGNWPRALRLGRPPAFVDPAPINMEVASSAGALCSTVTDLARWPGLLRSFLDPASYREMSEPTVLADGTEVPYGLGLQIRQFGSHPALSHGGVVNGFISMVADFPEDDLTVAILVNTRLLTLELGVELANRVLGAAFDEPASQWSDPLEAQVPGT
jgi:D-alanyl-D-alanine carboxypeptidase